MPRKSVEGKCQAPSPGPSARKSNVEKSPCEGNAADLENEVETLIAVAKSCCEREKIALQKKHEADLRRIKDQVLNELNNSFEREFVEPLRAKLQSLEDENKFLRKEAQRAKPDEAELKRLREEIKRLKHENENMCTLEDTNKKLKDDLKKTKSDARRRSSVIEDENAKLKEELERVNNELRMRMNEVEEEEKCFAEEKLALKQELHQQRASLGHENKALKHELENLRARQNEATRQAELLRASEKEVASLKKRLAEFEILQEENEVLRDQIKAYERDEKNELRMREEQAKKIRHLQHENDALKEQVGKCKPSKQNPGGHRQNDVTARTSFSEMPEQDASASDIRDKRHKKSEDKPPGKCGGGGTLRERYLQETVDDEDRPITASDISNTHGYQKPKKHHHKHNKDRLESKVEELEQKIKELESEVKEKRGSSFSEEPPTFSSAAAPAESPAPTENKRRLSNVEAQNVIDRLGTMEEKMQKFHQIYDKRMGTLQNTIKDSEQQYHEVLACLGKELKNLKTFTEAVQANPDADIEFPDQDEKCVELTMKKTEKSVAAAKSQKNLAAVESRKSLADAKSQKNLAVVESKKNVSASQSRT